MKIVCFSTQPYDREFLERYNDSFGFEMEYFETQLNLHTSNLAAGADAVCIFVNDRADAAVIDSLAQKGVKVIALRCAGFNNVDLEAAKMFNIKVCRVPAYSL